MTREELEKEAEEYGLQKALWCPSECGDLRDAFKDGAEFGYNKANEWHYVKDGDLPNNQRIVEVFTKDKDVFIAYIDSEDEEWSVGQYFRKVLPMNDVIAWKEIVLPKENEFKTEMFPKITLPEGSAEFVDKVIADAEKRLKENE